MRLSARLKSWLVSNKDISASSSDDEFRQTAAEALAEESLSVEKYHELTSTKDDESIDDFTEAVKSLRDTVADFKEGLKAETSTSVLDDIDEDEDDIEVDEIEEEKSASLAGEDVQAKPKISAPKKKKPPKMDAEAEDEDEMAEEEKEEEKEKKMALADGTKGNKRSPSRLEKMLVQNRIDIGYDDDELGEKSYSIRVKEAADNYDDTKSTATYPSQTKNGRLHPLAGRPIMDYSGPSARKVEEPSDRDKACIGAYCKFLTMARKTGSRNQGFASLPQHDRELLLYSMENMKWGGASDGGNYADIKDRKLTEMEQKALIDDSTSGGLEAAPIVFDDQVIQTPLLNGELYPMVNTIPLDRGRRVEGVATGTVTGSWGGVDDTAISLFDTASYVSAFDTTIYRWEGAIRIGLDFLSDSPIDFGAHVTAQYGERLLEDLDDVIAVGNGTTQPEGVMNKTGTTSVAFGGSTTIGAYESLRFAVAKAEHKANLMSTACFCGNETSYQRARAIPVGASDARRLGGTTAVVGGSSGYDDYRWMDRPYKINESMANTQLFYAILGRYRMYRRRGLVMRTSTEGDTLIRRNEMLMVAMARFGGQLERGAVAGISTTAEA